MNHRQSASVRQPPSPAQPSPGHSRSLNTSMHRLVLCGVATGGGKKLKKAFIWQTVADTVEQESLIKRLLLQYKNIATKVVFALQ